jgi:hypothetical protein
MDDVGLTWVDVEVIGLWMMLDLVFSCQETQTDMMLHVHKCSGQHGMRARTKSQAPRNDKPGRKARGQSCEV